MNKRKPQWNIIIFLVAKGANLVAFKIDIATYNLTLNSIGGGNKSRKVIFINKNRKTYINDLCVHLFTLNRWQPV